jgi:hypothetical protein
LLSTDAGREHFLNRLEIKEMNEIDVVEAVQEQALPTEAACQQAWPGSFARNGTTSRRRRTVLVQMYLPLSDERRPFCSLCP